MKIFVTLWLMTIGLASASPYSFMPNLSRQTFKQQTSIPIIDKYLTLELEDPHFTPKQKRRQAMHKLAAKFGIPVKEFHRTIDSVRDDLSYQRAGSSLDFSSKIILDFDEIGLRVGLNGWRGIDMHAEFSNKYSGLVLRKSKNKVHRRITVEKDRILYTAAVNFKDLTLLRAFSTINILGFFTAAQ